MKDLLELTYTLAGEHLSFAIDQLFKSQSLAVTPEHPWSRIEAHRCALSCVLHAYSGFDAALNHVGYELFFNPYSIKYVPPEGRDLPLRRMVESWNATLPAMDKLGYILSTARAAVSARLESELRELNNYRNWIVHGFS